jgi:hypothetical protein
LFFDDLGKNSFVNCPIERIKKLTLCSRDHPYWKWGDENWITIRGNDAEAEVSISDDLDKSDFSGRISGDYFCEDYNNCKIKDVSFLDNSLNFERGIGRLMHHSTLDFL